jgi:peptidoglycan hydrolase-like protein with peptidoglycan-binding domain
VINDRSENRDGYYGPATYAAVKSCLRDQGEQTVPQDGILGSHAYALLTGIIVEP